MSNSRFTHADRVKRPVISRIELYARHTSTVWGMLQEEKTKVPPRNTWPAGVSLPPTSRLQDAKTTTTKDTGSLESAIPKKPAPEKDSDEVCMSHIVDLSLPDWDVP